MKKFLAGLLIILVVFVLFSITPLVLMLVWNYVIAQLFAVPLVTFWQMFWITIALSFIGGLFKNSSSK
ncbi:MAG: hypothetical protein ABS916_09620 [Carnobacterium sp.]|uniref:hypothetical protein n=1 Tax=Carnobacterium sp. TaxID=48221 RepID=UPI003315FB0E